MTPKEEVTTRKYELMAILSGELVEKDYEKELGEVRKMIEDSGAKIFYHESWGRRDFVYRIKRQPRGYYAIFDFEAMPASIAELHNGVRLYPVVLRHVIVNLQDDYDPEEYKKPIVFGKKEELHEAAEKRKMAEAVVAPVEPSEKTKVAGKEEEENLKKVEKKLEQILENPDIDVR